MFILSVGYIMPNFTRFLSGYFHLDIMSLTEIFQKLEVLGRHESLKNT
jgi:hypothetical protein